MAFNIGKYTPRKNRTFRIFRYILKKRILPKIIKVIIWFLKFLLWLVPLFLSPFYYDSYNAQFSFNWVLGLYIWWTFIQYQVRKNYKYWQEIGQIKEHFILHTKDEVEFQKRFCNQYNPLNYIIILFLTVFIPVNHVPLWLYISIFIIINIYDTYDRRYLTNEIKQDLILEKLTIH